MEIYNGGSLATSSPSRKLSTPKRPHAGHARGMGRSIGILQWAHRVLTLGCDDVMGARINLVDASSLICTISGIHTLVFGDGAFWVQELLAGIMPLLRRESFVIPLVNLQAPKAGKHKSLAFAF